MKPANRMPPPSRRGTLFRAACLVLAAAGVLAVVTDKSGALPRIWRRISVSAIPDPLDLGDIPQPGAYDSPAALAVHLAANCAHGGVVISTTPFQSAQGGVIPKSRIFVKPPGGGQFVPLTNPVPVTSPAGPGVRDFQLQFRIETEVTDPAGTYTGTFQLITAGAGGYPAVPGPSIDCTVDLKIYAGYQVSQAKTYVHLGNVFQASDADLTFQADGSLTANTGMYVGLRVSTMSNITAGSFETDGNGKLTGTIFGAMAGTVDVLGRDISNEAIDLRILLSSNGGGSYYPPDYFGQSPDGNIDRTIWWLINNGAPGVYDLIWEMRLLPEPAHADGNYYFESEIVVTPLL